MTTVAPRVVPRGPTGVAMLGTLWKLGRDRLGLMRSAAETYGDAVRLGPGRGLHFFNHPDHAKHVLADNSQNYHKGIGLMHARRALGDGLLTSEGELWREQRRVIQPVFQARRIAQQAGIVAEEAGRLVDRLETYAGGEPVDMMREMTGLTLGVLGRTLLDADLSGFRSLGAAFESMQDQAMFEMASMNMVPMWVPLPQQMRFRRARRELAEIVDELAERRRARPGHEDHDDALSRLLASTRREPDPAVGRRRLRDELTTLLLAGHETTASTLGWTFHLLDRHPQVWERVRAEALEVLGDRAPTYEDLPRLTYTSMVLSEAMRLYPPVWMLSRRAQEADEVGGYAVPAGTDVLICPYTLHRHRAYWDEPDRFDPERFSPSVSAGRPRYAYVPFGAGPRFCVGNHLGLMEAVFVVAMVSRRLRLHTPAGHRVVPEPMLSLRIRGGLPMTVQALT
ncbi:MULTISPECIES: cytochrome P450 [unclassified Micromonospora]|uniref:cytochrome P450 n=1 Tax=unclassified Micromonospora TaxID=2617518 RepID=UPI001C5EFD55|nr:cytochrome P450 [Micromonospora sp. RL09-050-HVF-A]MBW4701512.1 cytochrome P450 [Micromonospora sp. RL09-050-HVF-A]